MDDDLAHRARRCAHGWKSTRHTLKQALTEKLWNLSDLAVAISSNAWKHDAKRVAVHRQERLIAHMSMDDNISPLCKPAEVRRIAPVHEGSDNVETHSGWESDN